MGEGKIIEINDETAKLLAQIITNEKALAILHAVEEEPKSLTQIAEELGFPLSTVSYHIDRMLRVGLVEVAGKKYGKKLQEVKLYRASNKPILIVPRREAPKVTKKLSAFEKLHVISLSIASIVSLLVYKVLGRFARPGVVRTVFVNNTSTSALEVVRSNSTTSTAEKFIPGSVSSVTSNTTNNTTILPTTTPVKNVTHNAQGDTLVLLGTVLTFAVVFAVTYLLLRRKRF